MDDSPADRSATSIEAPFDDRPTDDGAALERLRSVVATGARDGSLAIGVGVLLLWRAVRTVRRGWLRAVAQATIGVAVLRVGLWQRRSAADESTFEGAWERSDDTRADEREGGDGDEKVSDEAHAARHRPDHGREPETAPNGAVDEEPDLPGSETSDESAPEPAADVETRDPSKDPREADDEGVDLSEAALADEPGEATGPSDEQGQPTRTDEREQDLAREDDELDDESDE